MSQTSELEIYPLRSPSDSTIDDEGRQVLANLGGDSDGSLEQVPTNELYAPLSPKLFGDEGL